MSNSPTIKNYPESVAIWVNGKGGRVKRIPSPWVYKDSDGTWRCDACSGKEMCESHSLCRDHGRRVWYWCYGYGKQYGPGKLMNALDKSVRHNKDFKYDDQDASSSMLEPYGGVGDQKGNGESKAAAASTVEAQGNGRWAAAARAAVPAKVEQTKVEEFKIKDDSSKSSSSGVGQTTMGWKLDRVMKGTGEVMNKVREIADAMEADNVDTKIDEVKAGFERQAQLFDAKIKEYKQSLENTVPTVTSQMTEVKTSFDTKMPTLEAKIDEVKQSFESKAQTLTAQMAEVKTSFDAKVSTLEAKIDKLNDHIQEMKPWQGSPTLGMRASRSEGRLDTKR